MTDLDLQARGEGGPGRTDSLPPSLPPRGDRTVGGLFSFLSHPFAVLRPFWPLLPITHDNYPVAENLGLAPSFPPSLPPSLPPSFLLGRCRQVHPEQAEGLSGPLFASEYIESKLHRREGKRK